jgi:hypothetical protein
LAGRSTSIAAQVTPFVVVVEFAEGLLDFLEEAGVMPGRTGVITAASPDGTRTVDIGGRPVGIGAFASERIVISN